MTQLFLLLALLAFGVAAGLAVYRRLPEVTLIGVGLFLVTLGFFAPYLPH